ncbi:hypothetical protein AVEN_61678-1 [Araneus ventricosus]|uniref:Uncharacterized protein n=1 Tax=Araneus ventricosus TaxID=182803 RepID=A0A4Y2LX06_ARAVE|nr:hypothetical protein AVEN_61678-1 [Araneus ventricosus]
MSFTDLRTFERRVCETYKEACQLRGLLENDEQLNKALEEAAASRSPKILRYATNMSDAFSGTIMMKRKENLSEDILHQARIQLQNMDLYYCDIIFNRALIDTEDKIILLRGSDLKGLGLSQPNRNRDAKFADNVPQLGNGAITPDNQAGSLAMQSIEKVVKTEQKQKEPVFPNVVQHFIDYSWV